MSLRWRIALSYAALLVVALAAVSGTLAWRLQSILLDEAKASTNATMRAIVQSAQQASPFSLEDPDAGTLEFLFNSNNLANWSSPSTYVQVDSAGGYPLAKTSNLGSNGIPANRTLSDKHPIAYRTIQIDGAPFLVEDRLVREATNAAVIHVAQPLDLIDRVFAQALRLIVVVLVVATLAVAAVAIAIASQTIAPIDELSAAMRRFRFDRLDMRLQPSARSDEIGRLAASFNDLLARLEEAFARERRFIADASHELKTPLTSINANAQLLLRWGEGDPQVRRTSLETIADESRALAEMVNGMLTLAKADRGDAIPTEPVALAQLASEAVRSAAPRAAEKGLELRFEHDATPSTPGDPTLLRQLVGNLIDNAIKFSERGTVLVRVGRDGSVAWIDVEDTGPGIPPSELGHIFDRFYRADKARSRDVPGTGLGLAIVRSIARVHGGDVTVTSAASGGARFHVALPALEPLIGPS